MARCTAARVSGRTRWEDRSTSDTVDFETPAARAMSTMVAARLVPRVSLFTSVLLLWLA
jgi:hypothetical protein